ncbi:O-acetyl-ADP-ribose deacetylase (regulator of RNase III) [Bradyrhizobium sp. USDA 4341]
MNIRYVVGNLLEAREDVIVHGVNAIGRFGAGVAGAMATIWPGAKDSYLAAHASGRVKLGRVIWADVGDRVIGHAVTQPTIGRTGLHVSREALVACMGEVGSASEQGIPGTRLTSGFQSVAMPRIGAGLGGGDWRQLEGAIEETFEGICPHLDVAIYVLAPQDVPSWRAVSDARTFRRG